MATADSSTLILVDLYTEDSGRYFCKVSNKGEHWQTKAAGSPVFELHCALAYLVMSHTLRAAILELDWTDYMCKALPNCLWYRKLIVVFIEMTEGAAKIDSILSLFNNTAFSYQNSCLAWSPMHAFGTLKIQSVERKCLCNFWSFPSMPHDDFLACGPLRRGGHKFFRSEIDGAAQKTTTLRIVKEDQRPRTDGGCGRGRSSSSLYFEEIDDTVSFALYEEPHLTNWTTD